MAIVIEDSDPQWKGIFREIEAIIMLELVYSILSVEHVGSTSIEGLGAKPILDIDIVIDNYDVLPFVVKGLERLGYYHQENWSFEGREAFGRKDHFVPWDGKSVIWMEHNLYVCNKDSKELIRHLAFRDYLRNHPEAAKEYEKLKRSLAAVVQDRILYTQGKNAFVEKILTKAMEQT